MVNKRIIKDIEDENSYVCFNKIKNLNEVNENLQYDYKKYYIYSHDKEDCQYYISNYPEYAYKYSYSNINKHKEGWYENISEKIFLENFYFQKSYTWTKEQKINKIFKTEKYKKYFEKDDTKNFLNFKISVDEKVIMVSERTGQYQKNSINWIPITPISETEILPGMDLSKECPEVLGVISNKNLVLNKEFENEFFDSLAECNSYFNGGADYRLLFPEYLKKTYNEKKYISTFDMCNLKASHENNWTPLFSFFKQKIIVVPFKMEDLLNPLRGSLYENFYIIFKYSEENMFKIANAFYNPIFKDDENYTKENMKHLLYVYSNKRPKKFKDYENNFIYE